MYSVFFLHWLYRNLLREMMWIVGMGFGVVVAVDAFGNFKSIILRFLSSLSSINHKAVHLLRDAFGRGGFNFIIIQTKEIFIMANL